MKFRWKKKHQQIRFNWWLLCLFNFKIHFSCFIQCWSPDIRINRNPDIFGPFDRSKIDAPNSDTRIVKKTLFLEYFFMIFTFLHGSSIYTSSENYFFPNFCTIYYTKSCQKWRKNIVEENSENHEEHNDENDDENYDNITDWSFEASRLL